MTHPYNLKYITFAVIYSRLGDKIITKCKKSGNRYWNLSFCL